MEYSDTSRILDHSLANCRIADCFGAFPALKKPYPFVQCLGIIRRTGGMADAGDSKSPARKGVPVQVRGPVMDGKEPRKHRFSRLFLYQMGSKT